jgi:hypothetical protein
VYGGSEFGDTAVAAETRSDVLFDDGIEVAGVGHLDPLRNVFEDVLVVLVANHGTHLFGQECLRSHLVEFRTDVDFPPFGRSG